MAIFWTLNRTTEYYYVPFHVVDSVGVTKCKFAFDFTLDVQYLLIICTKKWQSRVQYFAKFDIYVYPMFYMYND